MADHQGKTVPTLGGIILFGHDCERHFPEAWIQAGRFAGSDKNRILDRIEIHFPPVQAVEEAIAFVHKQSWHGATIGAVRRTDRWSLPPEAVREALINAVVHSDYSQRGRTDPAVDLRRRAGVRKSRLAALRPHAGESAPWRVQDWPV